MTAPDLDQMRERTLRDIDSVAAQIKRTLIDITADAGLALQALSTGQSMIRTTSGTSPIGHQSPSDLARLSGRLDALLNQAIMLGCSEADIAAAYTQGA